MPESIEEITYAEEEELFFQQKDDPNQTAKSLQNWLSHQHFHQTIKCPLENLDLNPIQNFQAIIKRRLAAYKISSTNLDCFGPKYRMNFEKYTKQALENFAERCFGACRNPIIVLLWPFK